MRNKVLGVYGASGFGREVMPLVEQQFGSSYDLLFIDDEAGKEKVNGYSVVSYESFKILSHQKKAIVIAIANSKVRETLGEKTIRDGIDIVSVRSENSVIYDQNEIGEGAIFCAYTTVTSNVKIGNAFHCNIYSYVAHDCIIGDYVTFAPQVMCNGNVYIEDHVYIGTGAMIKQGTPDRPIVIGEGAVIGMGAVVTKSVKPGDVVFGVPAKSIKRGLK